MKLIFETLQAYEVAKTFLGGNDYKYTHYIDELAIRFYTLESFNNAMTALSEIGITASFNYKIEADEYRMPALVNGWAAA